MYKTIITKKYSNYKHGKRISFILILLFIGFSLLCHDLQAQKQYEKTPSDYEGPFYPITRQQDEDNDLTQFAGQTKRPQGDILNLNGVVLDIKGQFQKGVTIEIWQTDSKGRYKHPHDTSPGERDPYFQYWGKAVTKEDGSFYFNTIVPGEYAPRPAHIHFKVWVGGKEILTSQIYMKLDPSIRMSPRFKLQTIDLKTSKAGEFEGFFQIVIERQ